MDLVTEGFLANSTQNSTDNFSDEDFDETYLVVILFTIIFISGVLGNFTICIIFINHPSMRNVPNTYIFSLAFGDLLVILFCVPNVGLVFITESWPWEGDLGDIMCRGGEFAKDISIGVSIFTLVALAADRYNGIVNPLRKLQARSRMVLVIVVAIWTLAIIFAIPSLLVSKVMEVPNEHQNENVITYCTPYGQYERDFRIYAKYVTVAKATIYYFLPLSVIGFLYTLMAFRLQKSAKEVQNIAGCRSKSPQIQNRKHVARMVIVFILVFIVCFLPHWIFQLWFWLSEDSEVNYNIYWHIFRIISLCLYFLNSTLNPLALYFVSSLFRQHFHNYLCCQRNSIEHGASFSRGYSTYRKEKCKDVVTFVDTTNFTLT